MKVREEGGGRSAGAEIPLKKTTEELFPCCLWTDHTKANVHTTANGISHTTVCGYALKKLLPVERTHAEAG